MSHLDFGQNSYIFTVGGFFPLFLEEQMLVKTRHWPATVKKSISLILSSLKPYHVRRTPVRLYQV